MAKMMTTTTVAAMQQQQGVRLHVDESDMLGVGFSWELELSFTIRLSKVVPGRSGGSHMWQ